jgi:hypothetical protein
VTCDDTIAGDNVGIHVEITAAVLNQRINLLEGTVIK